MMLIVVDRCIECGDEVPRERLVNGLCGECRAEEKMREDGEG